MSNSYIGCIPGNYQDANWVLDMAGRGYSELELMVAELKNSINKTVEEK